MGTCVSLKRSKLPEKKQDFSNILLTHIRSQALNDVKFRKESLAMMKIFSQKYQNSSNQVSLKQLYEQLKHDIIFDNEFVYSNYLLNLFKQEFPDINILKDKIRDNNQHTFYAPSLSLQEDEGFLTNGANLDEILCDFLNSHSQTYEKFQIQEVPTDQLIDITRQDFKVVCQNKNGQKLTLDARLFIYDCHNDNKQMIREIHRSQLLKLMQPILSLQIHEEIIEISESSKGDKLITRYCVLYEIENSQQHGQISLQQQMETQWNKGNDNDTYSLEKVAFYMLQGLELLIFLQQLNIFSYLDITQSSLTLNHSQKLSLKSDLKNSFKLLPYDNDAFYLYMDLFQVKKSQFSQKALVNKKSLPEQNARFQIALIIQQMISKNPHEVQETTTSTQISRRNSYESVHSPYKKETYDTKFQGKIKEILSQLKETQLQGITLTEILASSYENLNQLSVFQKLMEQYIKERKYSAATLLYRKLISQQVLQKDQDFNNKINIMNFAGMAYLKQPNKTSKALQIFDEAYQLCCEVVGETNSECSNSLYWLAKAYSKGGSYDKSLELNTKAYHQFVKINGDNKPQVAKFFHLFYQCYFKLDNHEKALQSLESEIQLHKKLNQVTMYDIDLGKCYNKLGLMNNRMRKSKESLEYLDQAYMIYSKVLGDQEVKTQKVLKELSLCQMKVSLFSQAQKNFMYLLTMHQAQYSSCHVDIYNDCKQLGICNYELKKYKEALFYLEKALNIANKIFVIDKVYNDSIDISQSNIECIFESPEQEIEQYAFINYHIGLTHYIGFKNYHEADSYFNSALNCIGKVNSQQKEFVAELHYYSGLCDLENGMVDSSISNLKKALSYFKGEDVKDHYIYDYTCKVYRQIIKIQQQNDAYLEQAQDNCLEFIAYINSGIGIAQTVIQKYDKELDLAKTYQVMATLKTQIDETAYIKDIIHCHNESLRIFEKDFKNNKAIVIKLTSFLGNLYFNSEQYDYAINYLVKARKFKEQISSSSEDEERFNILFQLAQACSLANKKNEALNYYKIILKFKNISEHLSNFSVYEGYYFRLRLGELLESLFKSKDAVVHYDKAYLILKQNEDMEDRNEHLINVINALSYCYNQIGEFELALKYSEELHSLNKQQHGQFHPHTLNSAFAILNLYQKLRLGSRVSFNKQIEIRLQIFEIILNNFESLVDHKNEELPLLSEIQLMLMTYLCNKTNVNSLNKEFDQDQQIKFDFLLEDNTKAKFEQIVTISRTLLGKQQKVEEPPQIQTEKKESITDVNQKISPEHSEKIEQEIQEQVIVMSKEKVAILS